MLGSQQQKISINELTVVAHQRIISPFFGDVCSSICRGIAQSGSASGLGPEGREFESLCPDHFKKLMLP